MKDHFRPRCYFTKGSQREWDTLLNYVRSRGVKNTLNNLGIQEAKKDHVVHESKKESGTFIEYDGFATYVRTVADLVKLHKIDTEIWEPDSIITNYWEQGAKLKFGNIWHVAKTPLHQIKVKFVRKKNLFDPKRYQKKLIESIQKINTVPSFQYKIPSNPDLLVVPHITDTHFGKISFDQYGNLNYSLKIARQFYDSTIDQVLERVKHERVSRFCLLAGNDLINVDSIHYTTTRGTEQMAGDLWENMCVVSETCLIENIQKLSTIAPVDVVIVRSNHSDNSEFLLGRVLNAWFKDSNRVNIINHWKYIHYYMYGKVLLALLHGHTIGRSVNALDKIGGIISHEARELWGKAKTVEAIVGHWHHEESKKTLYKIKEYFRSEGATVRIGDTFAPSGDVWHTKNNFTDSVRRTQTFVYNKEGIEDVHFITP